MTKIDALEVASAEISSVLEKLKAKHFKPDCRLSFVMRLPGEPDTWLLVGDDDPQEIIATLKRQLKVLVIPQ